MIKFHVTPTYTSIDSASKEEISAIRNMLSFKDPEYHRKKRFCKFASDEIKFFTYNKFPTGLLLRVLNSLDEEDIKYKLKILFKFRKPKFSPEEVLSDSENRPYQIKCVKRALSYGRGYFLIATAGGKTEVARLIISCLGLKTLYLVHLKELLSQTRSLFANKMGLQEDDIGVIGDNKIILRNIVIATPQTLSKIMFIPSPKDIHDKYEIQRHRQKKKRARPVLDWIKNVKVFFIDECHHTSAESFYKIAMNIDAPYRFAMSGTPITGDIKKDLRLIGSTGECIYEKKTNSLKKEGYISDAIVKFIKINYVEDKEYGHEINLKLKFPQRQLGNFLSEEAYQKQVNKEYRLIYEDGIVNNLHRNKTIAILRIKHMDKKALILVDRIDHLDELSKILDDRGVSHTCLTGSSSSETRKKAIEDFDSGEVKTILTTIFKEGANLPDIELLIIAAGGKSTIVTKQRIGRGLRKGKSSEKLLIYDFYDDIHRYLCHHSEKRMATIRSDGFLVSFVSMENH